MTSPNAKAPTRSLADLQALHEQMLTLRLFEERIQSHAARGAIRGSTHLAIGQEAIPAGLRLATKDGDLVAPTYRGHTWALAWGVETEAAFAEMFGKETGCNRGRGGSKHLGSKRHGVLPCNAIVAAALPIAVGAAWSAKRDGSDQVVVVPFGDGATNQAVFHEALNLARIWMLPTLFVCENNLYSEMTPISAMSPFVDQADRASGYDIPAAIVDGMSAEAVADGVAEAVDRARSGGGPTFIEAKTYRFCGHMPGDTEVYRTPEEVSEWRERDPLGLIRQRLIEEGMSQTDVDTGETRIAELVDAAESLARDAAEPAVADIGLGAASWMEVSR